jgi:hypothetical protein
MAKIKMQTSKVQHQLKTNTPMDTEQKPEIINIQWCSNSTYRVSKPSWDGGKVVSLEDYNDLQSQLKELQETFDTFKKGMAKGSELYAHLRFDDQEFTPYQLALQQNERLLSALKEREWIDVKDRLPDESDYYWCLMPNYSNSEQHSCFFNKKTKTWFESDLEDGEFVTHWQPLPEPPKQLINSLEKQPS